MMRIRKLLRGMLVVLVLLFVAAQFVRPERSNPPSDPARAVHAHVQVPPQAGAILARACNDCHSNDTRWPWYSNVAPVSWFVIDHVNHGRSHLNFSDWAGLDTVQQAGMLDDICKRASNATMPLPSYLTMHSDARLAAADVRTLCEWARAERTRLAGAP